MPLWLDNALLRAVDALYSLPARPPPPAGRMAACRIVSHRGERNGPQQLENTYAAFDPLRGSGVFGLECDVRWTRDLVPMVFHDATLQRLFGTPTPVGELSRESLQAAHPQVPTLHDFVRRYAGEFHLFVELKHEPYPDPALQDRRLGEALAPALERGRCHVISLVPAMFAQLPSLPAAHTFGVARANPGEISRESLAARRGGFACHYALLRQRQIDAHHAAGQLVGCGFPRSRALLYREVGRGVDLVFTNQALALERWRREALAAGTPAPHG